MASPDWSVFLGVVGVTTVGLLVLSRATSRAVFADSGGLDAAEGRGDAPRTEPASAPTIPGGPALQANLAATHGLLAGVVAGAGVLAGVPWSALGVQGPEPSAVVVGALVGVGLALASEAAGRLAERLGVRPDERLRDLLAPASPLEWALLLGLVLPAVAVAEELLFRGALVGALGVALDVHPAGLVVGSSVLFGLGHVAQGRLGIAVTAALGLVLGAVFVLTGSLLTVVVAHYTVDVVEFVVHEWWLDDAADAPAGG